MIKEVDAQAGEIRRLKWDLLRVNSGRDILKKGLPADATSSRPLAGAYLARDPPSCGCENPLLTAEQAGVHAEKGAAGEDAFIAEDRLICAVGAMCRMLSVYPCGFYARLHEQFCQRALEDQRHTVLMKQAWDDSGEVCGYRKLHDDLCDLGKDISPNRAWRLPRLAGIRAQIGYKKKPESYGGSPAIVVENTLNREFDVPSR